MKRKLNLHVIGLMAMIFLFSVSKESTAQADNHLIANKDPKSLMLMKSDFYPKTDLYQTPNLGIGVGETDTKNRKPWLAFTLNFFLPGTGYIYSGQSNVGGVMMAAGAVGLTYVELQLQKEESDLYGPLFGSVFVLNTGTAIHAYKYLRNKNKNK